jgi:[protein-PII] uridylyltransferase
MNIVDARIPGNTKGRTDYTFDVLETQPLSQQSRDNRLNSVRQTINQAINAGDDFKVSARRTPPNFKRIQRSNSNLDRLRANESFTLLEVVAADRPGLLAKLARVFQTHHIQIQAAKITTLGERVEDVFHIVNQNGLPMNDPDAEAQLSASIQTELDQHI